MTDLVLFDIDATLLLTSGAGVAAMGDAGRSLYGPAFTTQGLNFAGCLDPLLIDELFARHGIERTDHERAIYRAEYARALRARLDGSATAAALPGTHALVDQLKDHGGLALGLLTGNFEETGSMKLRSCGFDPEWFPVRVWGDDSPHAPPAREHLPPVAFQRFARAYARQVRPERVTIIGDTPHDVRCAKVNGCRCLGVATGSFSVDQLLAAGADRVVPSLEATVEIAAWLLSEREPIPRADINRQHAMPYTRSVTDHP